MEPHQNIALSFKCPKQLNQLQPVNGDYYCDGCKKAVHDFRGMTEAQVLEVIANNSRTTCGIFESGSINVMPQHGKWLKWASAAMLALGITGLHNRLFAQANKQPDSVTNNQKVILGKSRVLPGQKFSKEAIIASTKEITQLTLMGTISAPIPEPEAIYREVPQLTDTDRNRPFIGEIMTGTGASFPGGETALKKYLFKNINNPHHFVGNAIALFTIEKDGSLSNIKIIKSAGKTLDGNIINTLKRMPKWYPERKIGGMAIAKQYTLPIVFSKQ
jgi:hypothetical protein